MKFADPHTDTRKNDWFYQRKTMNIWRFISELFYLLNFFTVQQTVISKQSNNPNTNDNTPAPMYPVIAADVRWSRALILFILSEVKRLLSIVRLDLICWRLALRFSICLLWFSGLFQYMIRSAYNLAENQVLIEW